MPTADAAVSPDGGQSRFPSAVNASPEILSPCAAKWRNHSIFIEAKEINASRRCRRRPSGRKARVQIGKVMDVELTAPAVVFHVTARQSYA